MQGECCCYVCWYARHTTWLLCLLLATTGTEGHDFDDAESTGMLAIVAGAAACPASVANAAMDTQSAHYPL